MKHDLTKYGFTKYHESKGAIFWEMKLNGTLIPTKIVVLSSILKNGNWCYDIYLHSNRQGVVCDGHSLSVANRYECETEEQLDYLLMGSHRLRTFIEEYQNRVKDGNKSKQ